MQTKLNSLTEQVLNVTSGFLISAAFWEWGLSPLIYAGYISVGNSLTITAFFTGISLVRGYFWRRLFNNIGGGDV
jgi:hypothetical protein